MTEHGGPTMMTEHGEPTMMTEHGGAYHDD